LGATHIILILGIFYSKINSELAGFSTDLQQQTTARQLRISLL
jgi:hypothetical protein